MWQCYSSLLDCSLLLKVDFGQQLLCPLLHSAHRKLLDVVCAELCPPLNYTSLPVFALSCLNKEHLGLFERDTKDCSGCLEHWEEDVFKAKTAFHVAVRTGWHHSSAFTQTETTACQMVPGEFLFTL